MANLIETPTLNGVPNQSIQFSPTGPIGSQFDDPGNASSGGSAALLRGTAAIHLWAGVTKGAGQTTTVRQATAAAIQAAITYAETNGKFIEMEPGIYEINNNGLQIGYSGQTYFRGGPRGTSRLIQFNTNVPVAYVGQSSYTFGLYIDGLSVEYGVSQGSIAIGGSITNGSASMTGVTSTAGISTGQTIIGPGIPASTTISTIVGSTITLSHNATYTSANFTFFVLVSTTNTSANTLQLGQLSQCVLKNIQVGTSNLSYSGYRGVYQTGGSEFQNVFKSFQVVGAQYELVNFSSAGTGSLWEDWYCRAGPGLTYGPGAINGNYAWNFANGCDGGTLLRVNMEAIAASNCFHTEVCRGMLFEDCHIETYWMTGITPAIFYTSDSRLTIRDLDIDFHLSADGGASTRGRLLSLYGGDMVTVSNLRLVNQSTDLAEDTLPFCVFDQTASTPDYPPSLLLHQLAVDDFSGGGVASQVYLSPELPLANYLTPAYVNEYCYVGAQSYRFGAQITVSATYTVYGAESSPFISIPATAAAFTLTLADVMYSGSTTKVSTGATIHVRRGAGTIGGSVTIKDGGGTTLSTSSTASTDYYYQFNGTAWALVT